MGQNRTRKPFDVRLSSGYDRKSRDKQVFVNGVGYRVPRNVNPITGKTTLPPDAMDDVNRAIEEVNRRGTFTKKRDGDQEAHAVRTNRGDLYWGSRDDAEGAFALEAQRAKAEKVRRDTDQKRRKASVQRDLDVLRGGYVDSKSYASQIDASRSKYEAGLRSLLGGEYTQKDSGAYTKPFDMNAPEVAQLFRPDKWARAQVDKEYGRDPGTIQERRESIMSEGGQAAIVFDESGRPIYKSPTSYSGLVRDAAKMKLADSALKATYRTLLHEYNENKRIKSEKAGDYIMSAAGRKAYEDSVTARHLEAQQLREQRRLNAQLAAQSRLEDAGYVYDTDTKQWSMPESSSDSFGKIGDDGSIAYPVRKDPNDTTGK